jgi:hypothetical protein
LIVRALIRLKRGARPGYEDDLHNISTNGAHAPVDTAVPEVHDGSMTATQTHQSPETLFQEADSKPVEKKSRKRAYKLRYVNMTNKNSADVPACEYCGACRYYISTGAPASATMFTPHSDMCPMPRQVFNTPERFADYASRKAHFLATFELHYSR